MNEQVQILLLGMVFGAIITLILLAASDRLR